MERKCLLKSNRPPNRIKNGTALHPQSRLLFVIASHVLCAEAIANIAAGIASSEERPPRNDGYHQNQKRDCASPTVPFLFPVYFSTG